MKQLCCSKYEQEITEQEFHLVQQKITYYNASCQSFECSPIYQLTLIDSIQNPDIRQQFIERYKETSERARNAILNLYMKAAEEQRDEYRKKFDANMKKMWSDRHSSSVNEKIPLIMINLIEQRYKKISERIQCIYKFKTVQSIRLNANS